MTRSLPIAACQDGTAAPADTTSAVAVRLRPRTPFAHRVWPEFSWSDSKERQLRRCPRAYLLSTYTKWNGWAPDAPAESRRAYICSKLTTLPLSVGTIVHRIARDRVIAARRGRRLESEREIRDRAIAELRAIYIASRTRRQAFIARPASTPMLAELFWREGLEPAAVRHVRQTIHVAAESLAHSPVFRYLCRLPVDALVVIDAMAAYEVDGILVYGAPDLVYWVGAREGPSWDARGGASCEARHLRVLDWKCGRHDAVVDQLALYAILMQAHLPPGVVPACVIGEVVAVADGGTPIASKIEAADLVDATQRVHAGAAYMRRYCLDPDANVPLHPEAFPPRVGPHCTSCVFRGICSAAREAGLLRSTATSRLAPDVRASAARPNSSHSRA
jgi:hypothetical protein